MTAERTTTTGAADADVAIDPAVAPSGATAVTVSPPPEYTEPGTAGPADADRGKDRDKSNRRKAGAAAEPPPAAFGGVPPPIEPLAAAGRSVAAEDAEVEALAAPAPPVADAEAIARPEATGTAPASRSRSAQAAPAKPAQSAAPPAAAAPTTQPSPVTGGGAAPAGLPSLPVLPLLPPAAAQPSGSPTGTTGSADAPTGSAGSDGGTTPTVAPAFSRAQEILDILIVLESLLGSGGMQMPGFAALESALQPSMGSGAAAAAENDLATFQQNEAGAFNVLDKELTGVLDALAGDNAGYQGDMRGIVLDVDARLAMLGPYAYTSAGRQQVAAILDSALTSALQICHSSQAQSVLAAAMIDDLAKGYLSGLAGPGSASGSSAAALAEKYLGWYEPQLQGDGVDEAAPYGESCADFVSSMLRKAGLINWHTNLVAGLASQLPAQGWTHVSPANAKPGDVWICNGAGGESHTEIVASNNNGHVTLIGSNNVSSSMQHVSYDSYSASIPGSYILAPP